MASTKRTKAATKRSASKDKPRERARIAEARAAELDAQLYLARVEARAYRRALHIIASGGSVAPESVGCTGDWTSSSDTCGNCIVARSDHWTP